MLRLSITPWLCPLYFGKSLFQFSIFHLLSLLRTFGIHQIISGLAKKGIMLDWEPECTFELISIVSHVRDYRICWMLNSQLNLQLEWKEEVPLLSGKGKQKSLFNRFYYNDELNWLHYHFINNKYLGDNLVPELKQVDHFLLVEGNNADQEKARIMATLKQSPMIQAVLDVDPNKLRSKQNLIFE